MLEPAHLVGRYVERRAGARGRIDMELAGNTLSFATGPDGAWQQYFGLVSDLPESERELLRVAEAHDERLLLRALRGELPAQADPGGAAQADEIALLVWGPRGSATRFRADAANGQLRALEFIDLDPHGTGEARQERLFEEWRRSGPGLAPLLAPDEVMVPTVQRDRIEGRPFSETSIDTLDLGQAVADSVFDRPGMSAATLGPSRRTIVPLVRRGDHHFADVRVGGGPPRRFLVDTGAGMTVLSRELAAELGLAGGDSLEILGLGGGTMARAMLLPPLTLGTLRLSGVRGLVVDLADLRQGLGGELDGVLGFSSLARYAVTFDFARGQLELAENATARVPAAGGTRVPFTMVGGQVIVPVRVDGGAAAAFMVDSGAWRTFLPAEVGAALTVPPDRRLPGIPSSGADGRPMAAEAVRIRSLAIGDVEVARPIVLVPAKVDSGGNDAWTMVTRARGVLGADILRRFRVVIDFPRQEMILEPAAAGGATVESPGEDSFSGPGVVLEAGAAVVVRRVVAGSPAAKAGIKAGDRVLAIDGATTAGVRAELLRQRLAGPAGSAVRLTVRRGGGREKEHALVRALLL